MMKIFVFLKGKKNNLIGGRCGYVANLFAGIEKAELSDKFVLLENTPSSTWIEFAGKMLSKFIFGSKNRKKFRRRWNLRTLGVRNAILGNLSRDVERTLRANGGGDNVCVCNSVTEFELVQDFLLKNSLSFRMVLISHHPCAPHLEIFESFERDFQLGLLSGKDVARKKEEFLQIEENAFRNADALLFPSESAMEPYFSTWTKFAELIAGKKLLFAETGVAEKRMPTATISDLEDKFGLAGTKKFRVCFLGRHNKIKGYDLLKNAAEILYARSAPIEFVIGGNQEGIASPLLPTWKECGYVNPSELFAISDLFVLPNRETYFDLVLLEALSAGIPVLASRTGGNKTVAQFSVGISLFDNDETGENLANAILRASEQSITARRAAGKQNLEAYSEHFTERAFALRFYNVLKNMNYEMV